MPLYWDVQPYAEVTKLVQNYTNAQVIGTRRHVAKVAEEATEWMRKNAPWKDRPEDVRQAIRDRRNRLGDSEYVGRGPQVKKRKQGERDKAKFVPDLHAREALVARALDPYSARRARDKLRSNLKAADRATLRSDNERRESAGRKLLTSVPKSRSALASFESQIDPYIGPIAQLEFTYDEDAGIWYAIWLEIAKGQRYSIIGKAVQHWQPKLEARLRSNMNLVQYQGITFGETTSQSEIFQQHVRDYNQKWQEMGYDRTYQPFDRSRDRTPEYFARRRRATKARREEVMRARSYENVMTETEQRKREAAASIPSDVRQFDTRNLFNRRRGR